MRILVDSLNLSLPFGTGITTYTNNFITNSVECGHEIDILLGNNTSHFGNCSSLNEILFFSNKKKSTLGPIQRFYREIKTCFAPRVNEISFVRSQNDLPINHAWHIRQLYRSAMAAFKHFGRFTELDIPGIDIAHWTSAMPICIRNAINVYTIHDIVPLLYPEFVLNNHLLYKKLIFSIDKKSDFILTVSENSRKDIISILGCDNSKVINTYQSIENGFWNKPFKNGKEIPEGLEEKKYFLFFGAVEPKKNIARIIAAHKESKTKLPLVLVVSQGWGCDDVWEEINNYSNDGSRRCIVIKYLQRDDLINIISHAKALIFPSLYEGFGLPALEAMALGTPVVGSTEGSLPEIIGQAGILVNPLSVEELKNAIIQLEYNPELTKKLIQAGKDRAIFFSNSAYCKRLSSALDLCSAKLHKLK
ncbi:glycosyltransferase family 4 protein [Zymomonas mobilis]|uniref:Glycosyl transferase group 1 n=1 Tax=Zymomonas mobilis subsp. mobilis (strain ATCC 10988 / DSM 424 / LMG 404 / NCIMB 8938 / NRRL B-806 / ZM1) TaxID=555217 RepID=A0A0H3FXD1_ZYMMA|nr:glycosyltransferase family 1 protein [Zymomonas mobilis]AEH62386.1 glycosyl transferase group 1 [Zymomonas mobilis subsp. mobilis ATCC 10988]TQL28019.1 glycosyltransferase involved in cell wall biosynthesis [Zymomonas mobilis]TQL29954.1 glycosyltransferase involved in cell wall biosynthesis [Zymomonas mobilis]